jgi:hypothetical protein
MQLTTVAVQVVDEFSCIGFPFVRAVFCFVCAPGGAEDGRACLMLEQVSPDDVCVSNVRLACSEEGAPRPHTHAHLPTYLMRGQECSLAVKC